MISFENTVDFVPHGRHVVAVHPAADTDPEFLSLQRLHKETVFELADADAENYSLGPAPEEELYCKGKIVVLSAGGNTRKCYTAREKIEEVVRCRFFTSPDRPCVLPRLILPSKVGDKEKPYPVIFALLHPLDDLSRVVFKQANSTLEEPKDSSLQIVFSDVDSSIVITYNRMTDRHSVWRVRRATPDDLEPGVSASSRPPTGTNTPIPTTAVNTSGSMLGVQPISVTPITHSASPSLVSTPGPSSRCSRPTSNINTPSTRPCSPVAPGSRLNSPQSMGKLLRCGVSPSFSSKVSARLGQTISNSMIHNTFEDKDRGDTTPLPLSVSLCFDHIWTEQTNTNIKEPFIGMAKKVFISQDPVGQSYFCFLLPNNQLSIVKFKFANNEAATMIFGSVEKIPGVVDAAPIPDLRMVLVLEASGCLTLYSGTMRVGKTILSHNVNTVLTQEIGALALDSEPIVPPPLLVAAEKSTSFTSTPILRRKQQVLNLKTNKNEQNLQFLSPVPSKKQVLPVELRDPVGRQVTIIYNSGEMRRVTLPKVSTSLVGKALNFVIELMPLELGRQLHGSWYTRRHAPGPSLSPAAEWDIFCKCILEKCGYQTENLDLSSSPELNTSGDGRGGGSSCGSGAKRSRTEAGTDGDWQYLLHSPQHTFSGHCISKILRLDHVVKESVDYKVGQNNKPGEIDSTCQLFNYLPSCFLALHLLYEELKLDTSKYSELPFLVNLLSSKPLLLLLLRLATDLQLHEYQLHYWKDFPDNCFLQTSESASQIRQEYLRKLSNSTILPPTPPCVFSHLLNISEGLSVSPFPILGTLNSSIKLTVTCISVLAAGVKHQSLEMKQFIKPVSQPGRPGSPIPDVYINENASHTVAEIISKSTWCKTRLGNLPLNVALPIISALSTCQLNPNPNWGKNILEIIGRDDLAQNVDLIDNRIQPRRSIDEAPDGLEGLECEVARLRWPKDLRRMEARRILQSCRPAIISLEQGPEVSDHDFVEEKEYFLKRICERTMALPIGRGMAALRSTSPLPTEMLCIPPLCLTGRAGPKGTKVELAHIDFPQNMDHWPCFHNGVASGLRLCSDLDSTDIDSVWIAFNRPGSAENSAETEHAGFLMALGLNGHLAKLSKSDAFDYLNKGSESISIGLMIGMAASHLGTMDLLVTKKLATQLEALLPPTATELPLSHNTQVASLLGVGLVYANTGHRHMVEVCVQELGKLPGPELENAMDRESYSLTAGLALGVITMGQERCQSDQIKEGDSINTDITSPGATLALGFMYWNTGNENIASWMEAPYTMFLLDFVRPDFLMLRTLAKGLILWNKIHPSVEWMESHVPSNIVGHCLVRPPDHPEPGMENLDYETINQAYCNIISGAAFVLALKFAGTWNLSAFKTLEHYIKKFIAISKRSISELTGKAMIEQTTCTLVLSQAIVMAGSGDLSVLRVCRFLRSRVHTSTIVTYGSHMAIHMAVGFLFLGGGRYGLARTPTAIAALIISCFPKFPTHSNDNRYHLQAFRHLYVLAVEPRLLTTRSTETGAVVPCSIAVQYADTPQYIGPALNLTSPTLLPDLNSLSSIAISDKSFWRTIMTRDNSWNTLRLILDLGGDFFVKKCGLSYSKGLVWSLSEEEMKILEENGFSRGSWQQMIFLESLPVAASSSKEMETCQDWAGQLKSLIAWCLFKEQRQLIPFIQSLISIPSNLGIHQAGFISHYLRFLHALRRIPTNNKFLEPETVISICQSASLQIDRTCLYHQQQQTGKANVVTGMRDYLIAGARPKLGDPTDRQLLSSLVALNQVPLVPAAKSTVGSGSANPIKLISQLKNSPTPASLYRLIR